MRNLLLGIVFVMVFCATAHAQSTVTVDSVVEWDNVSGAASYQCKLQDNISGADVALNDPATNDPDGNKIVDVAEDADGISQVDLSIWLTGKALGNYTFSVRSVDSNGNAGSWGQLALTYSAPPPPIPRVVMFVPTKRDVNQFIV